MRTFTQDGQLSLYVQDTCAGKTSLGRSAQARPKGRTSGSSSRKSAKLAAIPFMSLDLTPGRGNLLGEYEWEIHSPWRGGSSTLNTGVSPRDARVSSLSQILEDSPPRKYYLSRKACLGILRRSQVRRKPLPHTLEIALMAQAGLIRITGRLGIGPPVFHMNQRDESIDPGDVSGALMATANIRCIPSSLPRSRPSPQIRGTKFGICTMWRERCPPSILGPPCEPSEAGRMRRGATAK